MRYSSLGRAAPVGVLVALVGSGLGGCITTATYGTGEAPETTLLREATGGIFEERKAAIDYEPRAALVVPPSVQLPEPAPPPTQLAAGSWPVDAAQDKELLLSEGDGTDRRALSPEYVQRMRPFAQFMSRGGGSGPANMREHGAARSFLTEQNGSEEFRAALAEAEGRGNTSRRYLTDPPSHYREPAATAPAEFTDIEKKKQGSFLSRLFSRR